MYAERLRDYYKNHRLDSYRGQVKAARERARGTRHVKATARMKDEGSQYGFQQGQRPGVGALRALNRGHADMMGALAGNERAEQQSRFQDVESWRQFNNLELCRMANDERGAQQRAVAEMAAQYGLPSTMGDDGTLRIGRVDPSSLYSQAGQSLGYQPGG